MKIHTTRAGFDALRAMFLMLLTALFVALPAQAAGGGAGTGAKPKVSTTAYDYYLTGDEADVKPPRPATQMLVLMGGGEDVTDAFRKMIEKAGGTQTRKVDVVVIRTSGADGYNPYLFELQGVDSVQTLVIKTREAADLPFVNQVVAGADVLFIAGGDQSTYISLWRGTQLDATIQSLLSGSKVPFGGTSAGLAVLGDVDYTGENGSITSKAALKDPYDERLTLDASFIRHLPGLAGAITDSHIQTRDRMGRLVTFLARMVKDGLSALGTARGIGVDENTAVIADDGRAYIVGSGFAYFVKPTAAARVIEPRAYLDIDSVAVHKLNAGAGNFDLSAWALPGGALGGGYFLGAAKGALTSSQVGGAIY